MLNNNGWAGLRSATLEAESTKQIISPAINYFAIPNSEASNI